MEYFLVSYLTKISCLSMKGNKWKPPSHPDKLLSSIYWIFILNCRWIASFLIFSCWSLQIHRVYTIIVREDELQLRAATAWLEISSSCSTCTSSHYHTTVFYGMLVQLLLLLRLLSVTCVSRETILGEKKKEGKTWSWSVCDVHYFQRSFIAVAKHFFGVSYPSYCIHSPHTLCINRSFSSFVTLTFYIQENVILYSTLIG